MMDINQFITDNFIVIMIVVIVFVLTLIGYIAQKTEFGKKIIKKNKQEEENIQIDPTQTLTDNLKIEDVPKVEEKPDILDTSFNDGGLIVGDVNQNPDKTNEELGISEDLYAPFGDDTVSEEQEQPIIETVEPSIEELKIEDVNEKEDFNIIDKNADNNGIEELVIKDVGDSIDNNANIEELKIEDVSSDSDVVNNSDTNTDTIIEEISDLVDNTYVINDGTSDFVEPVELEETDANQSNIETEKIEESKTIETNEKKEEPPSVLANFDIDENEVATEEPTDFEIEATTSLKLDEINEKIKNLKLEDIDNTEPEEKVIDEVKKKRKKKQVKVKSVDDIKKETKKTNTNKKVVEDVVDMNLPNLDEVSKSQENKTVEETDDIWKF